MARSFIDYFDEKVLNSVVSALGERNRVTEAKERFQKSAQEVSNEELEQFYYGEQRMEYVPPDWMEEGWHWEELDQKYYKLGKKLSKKKIEEIGDKTEDTWQSQMINAFQEKGDFPDKWHQKDLYNDRMLLQDRLKNIHIKRAETEVWEDYPLTVRAHINWGNWEWEIKTLHKKSPSKHLELFVERFIRRVYLEGYETPFRQYGLLQKHLEEHLDLITYAQATRAIKKRVQGATLDIRTLTHKKIPFLIDTKAISEIRRLENVGRTPRGAVSLVVEETVEAYDEALGLGQTQKDKIRDSLNRLGTDGYPVIIATLGLLTQHNRAVQWERLDEEKRELSSMLDAPDYYSRILNPDGKGLTKKELAKIKKRINELEEIEKEEFEQRRLPSDRLDNALFLGLEHLLPSQQKGLKPFKATRQEQILTNAKGEKRAKETEKDITSYKDYLQWWKAVQMTYKYLKKSYRRMNDDYLELEMFNERDLGEFGKTVGLDAQEYLIQFLKEEEKEGAFRKGERYEDEAGLRINLSFDLMRKNRKVRLTT